MNHMYVCLHVMWSFVKRLRKLFKGAHSITGPWKEKKPVISHSLFKASWDGSWSSALATDAKMKVILWSLTLVRSSDDATSELTMFIGFSLHTSVQSEHDNAMYIHCIEHVCPTSKSWENSMRLFLLYTLVNCKIYEGWELGKIVFTILTFSSLAVWHPSIYSSH